MVDPAVDTLATLNELGGFFTLVPAPGPGSGTVAWASVLAEPALTARFATVRAKLAESSRLPVEAVDPKVAVSATQVGLASRLWSVALASAVLHGWVPDLSADNLVATTEHGGAVPLGVKEAHAGYAARPVDVTETARLLGDRVGRGPVAELEAACSRIGRTPRRVLASNSTSALVGGARVLAHLRPSHAALTWALTRQLLAHPTVAAGGEAVERHALPDAVGGAMEHVDEAFLRTGCCLFYRLPRHGLCPDCVLAPSRAEEVTPAH